MTDKCIFCDPAPGAVVYSGPLGTVLLDDPIRVGHVLVGIKEHHANLHDVSPEEAGGLFQLASLVSKLVVSSTGAEKTYVVAIGDKDKHFHVHLIPKMSDDPPLGPHVFSGKGWAAFLPPDVDQSELQKLVLALRRSLAESN